MKYLMLFVVFIFGCYGSNINLYDCSRDRDSYFCTGQYKEMQLIAVCDLAEEKIFCSCLQDAEKPVPKLVAGGTCQTIDSLNFQPCCSLKE